MTMVKTFVLSVAIGLLAATIPVRMVIGDASNVKIITQGAFSLQPCPNTGIGRKAFEKWLACEEKKLGLDRETASPVATRTSEEKAADSGRYADRPAAGSERGAEKSKEQPIADGQS